MKRQKILPSYIIKSRGNSQNFYPNLISAFYTVFIVHLLKSLPFLAA